MIRSIPTSPLFPYTTLFRSRGDRLLNFKTVAKIECALDLKYGIYEESNQRIEMKEYLDFFFEDEEMENFPLDRKSTRLNSSHVAISYAVFCLKKKRQYTLI